MPEQNRELAPRRLPLKTRTVDQLAVSDLIPDSERYAVLRLARSDGVGPTTLHRLIAFFGNAADAVLNLSSGKRPKGLNRVRLADAATIDQELERLQKLGAQLLVHGDQNFPKLLAHIDPPPPVLSVLGNLSHVLAAGVAIVGARNASANGRKLSAMIASGLGQAGETVISGFARGIDTAAHQASLNTGTVGVLAGGIDCPYPEENRDLYHAMVECGAVVSEMPPGFQARAREFPRRNRIIAGLSRGIVIVEAAERSGSLITARMALEQNRDVFAVPGSPLDARCRGTNQLLRDGAILTESAEDVLANLTPIEQLREQLPFAKPERELPFADDLVLPQEEAPPQPSKLSLRDRLSELLGPTPIATDELIRLCNCSPGELQSVLLELELDGVLKRHPGQAVSRVH